MKKYSAAAKRIIVPEMNMGQLIREVSLASRMDAEGINRADGKVITPHQIIAQVKAVK